MRGADGRFRTFLTRILPLKDASGRVIRWLGTNTDISELKQAEEKVRNSEERIRALLDSTEEAILGEDLDGNCAFCNAAAVRLLGYRDSSELVGRNLHDAIHHTSASGLRIPKEECKLLNSIRSGSTYHSDEAILWRSDGSSFPVECWGHPFYQSGKPAGSVLTFIDISERKRAEAEIRLLNRDLESRIEQRTAELRASEELVRRKLDSILLPEGDFGNLELVEILDIPAIKLLLEDFYSIVHVTTALLDLHGNVLTGAGWQNVCLNFHRVNPETCKNCHESDLELSAGIQAGEFKIYKCKNNLWDVATPIVVGGKHIGNLFCGQFFFVDEPVDYEIYRAQARQHGFDEEEYMAALKTVPCLTREQVNASMTFLAKLAKMISQLSYSSVKLARSTEQVNRANAELQDSVKEMEAFSYSVSHDLRAPLRHLSGFSKILVQEFGPTLPEDARRYLDRIQESTRRMGQLIDDLLDLGRVGRREVTLQVVGLKSVVDEVIAGLKPDVGARDLEWKIGTLPFADCDAGLMKQVFQNLLANAVKFTRLREHAVIEIGQTVDGVIFVRDNGVGFSMKYSDKLFGVFQRLHRQEDFEGTGVGLATVQRIVQKHGGRIWAEAALDKGATFFFTLGSRETNGNKSQAAVVGEKT